MWFVTNVLGHQTMRVYSGVPKNFRVLRPRPSVRCPSPYVISRRISSL